LATADGPITSARLRQLTLLQAEVEGIVERRARHGDINLWQALRDAVPVPNDPAALHGWEESFRSRLQRAATAGQQYEVATASGDVFPRLTVTRRQHGDRQSWTLGEDFFAGGDYRLMVELRQQTAPLDGREQNVVRGERRATVERFSQTYAWLMSEARRGLHVQRYKGLGEMNPEQLWETTLDPANRRLVRVHVDDAVAADQIFTTLMGEEVEPRREFIERHALLVGNLDV
jgi:DNA gyrase subunit B